MNICEIYEALGDSLPKAYTVQSLLPEVSYKETKDKILNHPLHKENISRLRDEARRYIEEPIKAIPFSLYKLYETTGNRKIFENDYFDRRGRLSTLALLSWLEEKEEYLPYLEDIIWAICEEYTWALPAHLEESLQPKTVVDVFNKEGKIESLKTIHRETVDLFACETGHALAEILALLEDKLHPMLVKHARREIYDRLLKPYMEIGKLHRWETFRNNWNAVCAGSIGMMAIYIVEDSSVLAPILQRVMDGMEVYLQGFEADGACTEGVGYWTYGFGFFTYFADLLKKRTNGKIDYFKRDLVKTIALFQQKVYLSQNCTLSFADGSLKTRFQIGLTSYLKGLYEEVEIPDLNYFLPIVDDHCHRWAAALRDLIWSKDLGIVSEPLKPKNYFLEESQWFISRGIQDEKVITLGIKGGHNEESHNHNDIGTFILHVDGENLITDLGAGEYTKDYFGDGRYNILCNSSRGHSVPIIGNRYQEFGKQYRATQMQVHTSDSEDEITMECSKAYHLENLKSFVRKVTFDKAGHDILKLQDSYKFEKKSETIVERFVSLYPIELIGEDCVIIQGEKNKGIIRYDSKKLHGEVSTEIFIDHHVIKHTVYFIDFKVKESSLEEQIELAISIEKN